MCRERQFFLSFSSSPRWEEEANPCLEPISKRHNMRVVKALQQVQLVVHHLLVAFDILLEDDLDGDLAGGAFSLADDTVGACSLGLVSLFSFFFFLFCCFPR